jgi:hypothetical protein
MFIGCSVCGKEKWVKPSHIERGGGRFCSWECRKTSPLSFWQKVDKTGDCWIWLRHIDPRFGYGITSYKGKAWKTHRLAWFFTFGEIPENMKVLHKCDNTKCVRPDHLFLGTQEDNIKDMVSKNRQKNSPRFGEENPMSKLTEEQVKEIRSRYVSGNGYKLAKEFGVWPMTINRIVRNVTWRTIG